MSLWQKITAKFKDRFFEPSPSTDISEVLNETVSTEENIPQEGENIDAVTNDPLQEIEALKATLEKNGKFQTHNIVAEKLDYLEQYIKIFSLNFPNEYAKFLDTIQKQREEYNEELEKYRGSFNGDIAFTIDPESESQRLINVKNLEIEIKDFVEYVVNYSVYETKFSTLASKLNTFYNALLDTKHGTDAISNQLNNGINTMASCINEVSKLKFFNKDLRKREKILNYIIYGEYIFFKTYLRCCLAKNFDDYKYVLSKFHNLFVSTDYDKLIFKFIIEDLEQYQLFITSNLSTDPSYNYILNICENLQNSLTDYSTVYSNSEFFTTLIQFENTVDGLSQGIGNKYVLPLPPAFKIAAPVQAIEVKSIATALLNTIDLNKASLLSEVISNFTTDISWREFYFLCKIFELHSDVIKASTDTIFDSVQSKFVELSAKYSEYSDSFINAQKQKLLRYTGSKPKKYVFLVSLPEDDDLIIATKELESLKLDFCICGDNVYINHSYFSGFKNLNENFGQYKLMEELT